MGKYEMRYRKYKWMAASLVLSATLLAGCGNVKKQNEYKQKGIAAMEEEDYAKALSFFQKALKESGGRITEREADICYYKATAQYRLDQPGAALATLDSLVDYHKNDAKASFLKGMIYADTGKAQKAYDALKEACETSKENEMYENAYMDLIAASLLEQAEQFFEIMPSESKASEQVLRQRVLLYEKKADYKKAYDAAMKFLKQYPQDEDMQEEIDFLKSRL
jgi:Flp pilus assembly protein TadD